MAAARKRLELNLMPEAKADLKDIETTQRREAERAMIDLLAHPRAGDNKAGRLNGAWSWRFPATPDDNKEEGRIVYRIKDGMIIIFAVHPDHDEAYKRARKRAAKYL